MDAIENKLRHQVAAVSLLLNAENILGYSGHVSVRLPGRDEFLIQPVGERTEFAETLRRLMEMNNMWTNLLTDTSAKKKQMAAGSR